MTKPTPDNHLHQAVTERLLPLFQTAGETTEQARTAARQAVAAYHPQSPADYASIARIIAFSLAAIAAIGRSAASDLPASLQLRFLGKANTLSRSADQAERALIKRRQPQPQPQSQVGRPTPEPRPADAAILTQIDAAMAEFRALVPDLPPQSFRQSLRHQAPVGLLQASG